ncbi:PREDICTED: limbin [Condylura cristata]|uniref:limbin n=1 Tax=Condylura cristata TaxID=143302 RepID=UPI00064327F1|nr:PREDICTED: limbin [Condylura cristata]
MAATLLWGPFPATHGQAKGEVPSVYSGGPGDQSESPLALSVPKPSAGSLPPCVQQAPQGSPRRRQLRAIEPDWSQAWVSAGSQWSLCGVREPQVQSQPVLPGAPRPCAETPRRGAAADQQPAAPTRTSPDNPASTSRSHSVQVNPQNTLTQRGRAVETPFRRNRTRERGASDPPPTSAASRGPGAPSARALIPVWPRKTVSKRDAPLTRRPYGERTREAQGAAENTVVFQKCAVVSGPQGAQTAQVQLLVNNTRTPAATALSDLLLLDNITGLHVGGWPGNRTADGLQAFSRQFLQVGDALLISYTASLDARGLGSGAVLTLPARLSFSTSTKNRTQLEAPFTLTVEEKLQVLPDHGLHAAAFFSAFLGSLALACLALFVLRCRCWAGAVLSRRQVQHHENKLEHSQFTSADGVNEDLALDDQMINILCSEDPESMLQALEELEVATLNRADSDLEARRAQISKDVVALLLRSLSGRGHLAPQAERRMAAVFKKQFLLLEKEVQEEYDRKMVAVTAECDLDMRKKTERQHQREMAAMEEAEELLKRSGDRSAAQCSSLLRTLHSLEREQLHRSLALQQEEDVARARRQLAVFQRNELHGLFFTQIRGAISKGELQPEAAKGLLQEYARTQEDVEELMDFLQASKRFHLSKRFGHREYLVQSLRSSDTRVQGLLEAAAAQLSALIQKHERKLCASPLSLSEEESLRAQQEVHGCFAQMDRSLALPRIRAQVLLQQCQTAWREAECLRLDEALAAPEQQHPPKARKSRSKSKIGLLKKSLEDKIQLFEEQAPDDLLEKVRGELRGERVRQLEAQEARFVGSLVSLQFQKAARMARTLRAYAALLSTQDLLLEGLSASETLTKAACAQILGSHGPELQELERKLEDKLAHQEAAWRLQAPHSGQQWAGDGSQLLTEPDAGDSDGQVSAVLQRALSLAQRCLRQYQQG